MSNSALMVIGWLCGLAIVVGLGGIALHLYRSANERAAERARNPDREIDNLPGDGW